MKHARIVNGTAVDVRTESPEGFFHPDIAAQFVEVPDEVENGWTLNDGVWSAPPAPEPVPEPMPMPMPTEAPKVSPVEFKLLFTAQERVAIKQSGDPIIQDFFELVENQRIVNAADPNRGLIDLGLQSTKDAIGYLQSNQFLTADRAAEILAGKIL